MDGTEENEDSAALLGKGRLHSVMCHRPECRRRVAAEIMKHEDIRERIGESEQQLGSCARWKFIKLFKDDP